jgi:hypothetical protein
MLPWNMTWVCVHVSFEHGKNIVGCMKVSIYLNFNLILFGFVNPQVQCTQRYEAHISGLHALEQSTNVTFPMILYKVMVPSTSRFLPFVLPTYSITTIQVSPVTAQSLISELSGQQYSRSFESETFRVSSREF